MYDWFGKDWPKLKKQVIMLSVSYSNLLFQDDPSAGSVSSKGVELFSSTLLADIRKRTKEDELGMWKEALSLFAFFDRLINMLDRDLSSSSKKETVSQEQALGQNLRYYFEDARRELVAAEIDETPSKIKAWERLDRLSRKLASDTKVVELYPNVTERCSEEHFQALLEKINQEYAGNYNYPHKLNTIRSFFFKLSSACKDLEIHADTQEIDRYSAEAVSSAVKDTLFGKVEQEVLYECLSELDSEEFELLDVEFKLELHSVQYLSEKNYRQAKGYTPTKYNQAKERALANLRHVFEQRIFTKNCDAIS